jgi:acetyl coenzyme A synthetase (ADP forming)-like protein
LAVIQPEFKMQQIHPFFYPQSIAVIGASRKPGSLGKMLIDKLLAYGYQGGIYPVNPKATAIAGLPVYQQIEQLPANLDLAIILVPKQFVHDSVEALGKHGIKSVIVITAGFKETGPEGAIREKQLLDIIHRYNMKMVGPNCMGVINTDPSLTMNASFSPTEPFAGNIAFISQSGALGVAVLEMAKEMHLGFSLFASVGNKSDLVDADFIEYCGQHAQTKVITMYMESIDNPEKFKSIAAEITKDKPVIAIKSGRTSSGAKAASSHTGALASSDRISDAFLQSCGVIRADNLKEMFDLAQVFSTQPPLKGKKIGVVTNAGGPAIMATDAIEENGLELAELSEKSLAALAGILPEEAAFHNPVDMLASADHKTYQGVVKILQNDTNVDAIVAIIVRPPVDTTPAKIATEIAALKLVDDQKPIVAVVMAAADEEVNLSYFRSKNIPVYQYPENAANSLRQFHNYYTRNIGFEQPDRPNLNMIAIRDILTGAKNAGRSHLLQAETFTLFEAMDFPVPQWKLCRSATEAIDFWQHIQQPIVMKIESEQIQHKSDTGGVQINLNSANDIRIAWDDIMRNCLHFATEEQIEGIFVQAMAAGKSTEIAMGIVTDSNYGKMIMLGLGGIFIEVLKDVVFWPAQINGNEALAMIEKLKFKQILEGARGLPAVDKIWLSGMLIKLGYLAQQCPEIEELDINPLKAAETATASFVLDGRIRIS